MYFLQRIPKQRLFLLLFCLLLLATGCFIVPAFFPVGIIGASIFNTIGGLISISFLGISVFKIYERFYPFYKKNHKVDDEIWQEGEEAKETIKDQARRALMARDEFEELSKKNVQLKAKLAALESKNMSQLSLEKTNDNEDETDERRPLLNSSVVTYSEGLFSLSNAKEDVQKEIVEVQNQVEQSVAQLLADQAVLLEENINKINKG